MDRIEQQDAAIDALLDAQEIYEQIGMHLQALQISALVAVYSENRNNEVNTAYPVTVMLNG